MKRRAVLGFLSSGAVAWPFAAWAQQVPAQARIGWSAHGDTMPRHFFERAMVRFGWVEGQNLVIERRFTGSAGETLAADAAALVGWKPDIVVAMGAVDAIAIPAVSQGIPIVVVTANDPVRQGLAVSLSQPGGNVTGTASITGELLPKLVELLHELLLGSRRASVLGDPSNPGHVELSEGVGKQFGLSIVRRHATRSVELEPAFATAVADGDQAMIVQFSALTFEERWRVTALAKQYRLPCVYGSREYVQAGGLISYGPIFREDFKRAAVLVEKILRGAKPANLPIEQPTHFELVVNQKAAKQLGLTVPQSLLARADEVIE
jgi:ABC-type uncharacterized transport system substrate-binding protein